MKFVKTTTKGSEPAVIVRVPSFTEKTLTVPELKEEIRVLRKKQQVLRAELDLVEETLRNYKPVEDAING